MNGNGSIFTVINESGVDKAAVRASAKTTKANNVSGSTTDGTWIVLPENISFVAIQVDAQGATVKANIEFTQDRDGAIANSVTCFENWEAGEINDAVQGAEFAPIAGIRLNPVVAVGDLPKLFYQAG